MDKEKFEDILQDVITEINKNDLSEEEVQERIKNFCDVNGKMDIYSMVAYLTNESRLYTQYLMHDLFIRLIDEGLLK